MGDAKLEADVTPVEMLDSVELHLGYVKTDKPEEHSRIQVIKLHPRTLNIRMHQQVDTVLDEQGNTIERKKVGKPHAVISGLVEPE